jgi:hypothetical protein
MKVLTILLILSYSLCQYPTVGQFILVNYNDSNCVTMIPNSVSQFNTSSSCWTVGNQSINPSTYNSTSNRLEVSFFNSSNSCGGSNINMLAMNCSLSSCQPSPFNSNQYLKCMYSNVDLSAKFNISSFSDNKCTTNTGTGNYSPNNYCWSTSQTSSVIPYTWNSASNTLSLVMFGNNQCIGGSTTTTAGNMVCDGSCVQSGTAANTYYSCKLPTVTPTSSSKFVMMSVSTLILFFFISLLI